jgi:hypothetical protein
MHRVLQLLAPATRESGIMVCDVRRVAPAYEVHSCGCRRGSTSRRAVLLQIQYRCGPKSAPSNGKSPSGRRIRRSVPPAVTGKMLLHFTIDIEFAHHSRSINWRFPNRRSDSFAVPCHVVRQTDFWERNRAIRTSSKSSVSLASLIYYQRRAGAAPSTWRISPLT